MIRTSFSRAAVVELAVLTSLVGLFVLSPALPNVPACPIRCFGGYECPMCGTTRSLWHLGHGHFQSAWAYNPVGYLVVFLVGRRLVQLLARGHRWIELGCSARVNHCLFTLYLGLAAYKFFR